MKSLAIDTDAVDKCTKGAMQRNGKSVSFFDEDRDMSKKIGVIIHPSLSINNITYRGLIDGFTVFKAICAGFMDRPQVCKNEDAFKILAMKGLLKQNLNKADHARVLHIVVAVVMVVILNLLALFMYRKYHKKRVNEELQLQVNSAVSQYFRLSGTE